MSGLGLRECVEPAAKSGHVRYAAESRQVTASQRNDAKGQKATLSGTSIAVVIRPRVSQKSGGAAAFCVGGWFEARRAAGILIPRRSSKDS